MALIPLPRRFIKWSPYWSTNKDNPDVLQLKVVATETFETKWTTNVLVKIKEGKRWREGYLKLHSHDSDNVWLLNWWNANVKSGRLQQGKQFKLLTWLGVSKNERGIRRFRVKGL